MVLLYFDRKARRVEYAALAFSLVLTVACGYVGDPLPPLVQIPARVSDLSGIQVGKSIKLSWTLPKLNTDGSAAITLSRLEVYRFRGKADSLASLDVSQFNQYAMKWMVLDKANFDAYTEGDKIVLPDRLANLETSEILQSWFAYAVKVVNRKKQEAGFSNLISVRVFPVPNPPDSVHFRFEEGFTQLNWQPPVLNIDSSVVTAPLRYNVYRTTVPSARVRERLTATPISETDYRDTTMSLGETYYYTIRAVIESPEGQIESFDSKEYEAKNVDTYPPHAPQELTAISDGHSISLVWLPNSESDLAGYYVYRAGADRDFKRVTPLITIASFNDKSVEKGKTYIYRVKALDQNGNESDNSEEVIEGVE